jgi:hypothetical protein
VTRSPMTSKVPRSLVFDPQKFLGRLAGLVGEMLYSLKRVHSRAVIYRRVGPMQPDDRSTIIADVELVGVSALTSV